MEHSVVNYHDTIQQFVHKYEVCGVALEANPDDKDLLETMDCIYYMLMLYRTHVIFRENSLEKVIDVFYKESDADTLTTSGSREELLDMLKEIKDIEESPETYDGIADKVLAILEKYCPPSDPSNPDSYYHNEAAKLLRLGVTALVDMYKNDMSTPSHVGSADEDMFTDYLYYGKLEHSIESYLFYHSLDIECQVGLIEKVYTHIYQS